MTERRYSEEEAAGIFEQAAKAQQGARRSLAPGDGMTLADLKDIGHQVGIPGDLVAQAAKSLDEGGKPASRSLLGFPLGVGRTVEFDRLLTEDEWERLVVDLRETFDARGRLGSEGSFRQWTNGNLQALLEPTATGHRLRLRTVNGNARAFMTIGLAVTAVSTVMLATATMASQFGQALVGTGPILLVGLGMFGLGALRLPGWARRRQRQMEAVAARLTLAARTEPGAEDDTG